MLKKIVLFLFMLLTPLSVLASDLAKNAKSGILIEESTGKVLFEKEADKKMYPASMTKIMTLLLVMDSLESGKIKLTDMVNISPNASSMGGSQVFLEAGSSMKLEELLKSVTIASANDSSVALAEFISGSVDKFVIKMNQKCKEIGCKNTNFANVHGLHDDNHYTTAKDMSLIAKELLKYKNILNYTSIYEAYLNKPDGSSTWMVNTNKLIRYYNGLDGLKTGYTKEAGYCLTATAVRNNMRLISILMNEPSSQVRNSETIDLLNYGFSNYKIKTILSSKKDLGVIEVKNGKKKTVHIKLVNDATNLEKIDDNLKYSYKINVDIINAPVKVGDVVGKLEVIENNNIISKFDITVKEDVLKANFFDLYKRNLNGILIGG